MKNADAKSSQIGYTELTVSLGICRLGVMYNVEVRSYGRVRVISHDLQSQVTLRRVVPVFR